MPFTRIKYFLAVVISGTFSEAAEVMHATQATVSKQIMALEKELGFSLFDRRHRKAELTSAGKIFLSYAQQLMNIYNEMNLELAKLEAFRSGNTSVASIPVMAHYGIISLFGEFRKNHPQINIIVDERESCDILQALDQNQYEMAFMRGEGIDSAQYEWIELFTDRLAAAVWQDHPLAARKQVALSDLKNEDFVLLGPQSGMHSFCLRACKQAGFTPHIVYTGTRMENIIEMVSQGMGISLLMETPAHFVLRPNAVMIPISPILQSQIVLVRRRKHVLSGAGKAFWTFIRQKKKQNVL